MPESTGRMTRRALPIRWVAFDAVGTLIHPAPSVAEVYRAVAHRHGAVLTVSEVGQRFKQAMSARIPSPETDETQELQFWRSTVQDVLGNVDHPDDCFSELYEHFARPESWQLRPDAVSTLAALHAHGLQLAIASNFDHRLNRVLDGMPQLGTFNLRVISSEIGWRKPHPRFYEILLARAGARPNELLMVGDEFELDIAPARKLGIPALHLVGGGARLTGEASSRTITSLSEILTWFGIDAGQG